MPDSEFALYKGFVDRTLSEVEKGLALDNYGAGSLKRRVHETLIAWKTSDGAERRCPAEKVLAAGMTKGSAYLFDYRLLHRGPGNRSRRPRDVLMLAYSTNWFFNGGALANRGRSSLQLLHQARYWQQWHAHPKDPAQFFLSVERNDETRGGERGAREL